MEFVVIPTIFRDRCAQCQVKLEDIEIEEDAYLVCGGRCLDDILDRQVLAGHVVPFQVDIGTVDCMLPGDTLALVNLGYVERVGRRVYRDVILGRVL